jgi:cytochrome oxidase Cu insertion factor (SCO1/SenC/PrrC family)
VDVKDQHLTDKVLSAGPQPIAGDPTAQDWIALAKQPGDVMNTKRVLIPILMLAVCAAILVTYNLAAMSQPSPTATATRTPGSESTAPLQAGSTATIPPTQGLGAAIPAVGTLAPDFTLPSVWGDPVTLSSYRGEKNIVLLFYRTGG